MYTATSIDVFIAAYAGSLGGMRSTRNVSQNTNPAHYVHLTQVALAFAESFDTEYASILPNDLQLAEIEAICSEQMNGRQPGGKPPTTPAFWTKPVRAIIALLSEADSIVAANVTNPIPFPSPPAGIPVVQIRTVVGVTNSLKSTVPATGIAAIVDGYTSLGDGGGGTFFWNATNAATDDGGTIINPTGHVGAGRWVRIFSGPVSIAWFGAIADARGVSDAAITAGLHVLTSLTATFTAADKNKYVSVDGAKINNLTGTCATRTGSRGVIGTGTKFADELWLGAAVRVNGTDYTVVDAITGTVALASNTTLVGTGTKFTDELYLGCEVAIYGGTGVKFKKYLITTITDDTHATLSDAAPETATGMTCNVSSGYSRILDQTHLLLSAVAGATGGGLTMRGPASPLVTTIASVMNPTTVVLTATADITVITKKCVIFTDNQPVIDGIQDFYNDILIPPPVSSAVLLGDTLGISPGTFGLASELIIDQERTRLTISEWARFAEVESVTIDAGDCAINGPLGGYSFGAGQGSFYDYLQSTQFLWIGKCAGTNVRVAFHNSADGSTLRGLMTWHLFDNALNGSWGMTGFQFGQGDNGASVGDAGIVHENLIALDCYTGFNLRASIQQTTFRGMYAVGHGASVIPGACGMSVGADCHYPNSGAITTVTVDGYSFQGLRIGVQVGGAGDTGPAVASFMLTGEGTIEGNDSPELAVAVLFGYSGGCSLHGLLHTESEPGTGYTARGIQVGTPKHLAENVVIGMGHIISGFNAIYALYAFAGLQIAGNYNDTQGNQDATHPGIIVNNVGATGAGLVRNTGVYRFQLKPGGGTFPNATEIDNYTGFAYTEEWNQDGAGVLHPLIQNRIASFKLGDLAAPADFKSGIFNFFTGTALHFNTGAGITADGSFLNWAFPDAGGGPGWALDNGTFLCFPKYNATAGLLSHVVQLQLRQNVWDGATNLDVANSFLTEFPATGAGWKMTHYWSVNGQKRAEAHSGPGWATFQADGNTALPNFATPAIIYGQDGKVVTVQRVRDETVDYTIVQYNDQVIAVGILAAAKTIKLPAAPVNGEWYTIKDAAGSAASFNITVDGNGHNVDNLPTFVMNVAYSSITVVYDTTLTVWMVV